MQWNNQQQLKQQAMQYLGESFNAFYQHSVATDASGTIVWISEAYCEFLGLDESPLARHISEVIPDSRLPGVIASGQPVFLDLLQVNQQWVVISVIPLTSENGEVIGAFGYVATDSIHPLINKYNNLEKELKVIKSQLKQQQPPMGLSRISGSSKQINQAKQQIRQASRFDISVLLQGETGTGKELFARALHDLSPRNSGPFISINVAAIPDELIEAEFFGSVAGAYTGASKTGRKGKLALANGGSLFLDEIGDMPLAVQAKLLRVLQEKEFSALGSDKLQHTDIRIIAATSRDLAAMVEQGLFRADLYYRLSAMPVQLPALRQRPEDIPQLCEAILDDICVAQGITGKQLSPAAVRLLRQQNWEGNIRELRNVLERSCVLHNGEVIEADFIASILPVSRAVTAPIHVQPAVSTPQQPVPAPLRQTIAAAERQSILEALSYTGGRRNQAADILGISRATLYTKMAKLGMDHSAE